MASRSPSAEFLSRWKAVLSEAEIAARPMPHDDSEETDVVSYVQKWGAAMNAIAEFTSEFKHQGFPAPVIPAELDGLFKDAVAFYNAHLLADAPTSDAETIQPSSASPAAHRNDKRPTTQPDNALGPSTEDKATVSHPPKPTQSAPPRTGHYRVVSVMSSSGKIVSEDYNGSEEEEQKMRIQYPAQPCSACKDAGTICTGPVVGVCARCKISRHGCSNSSAGSKVKGKDAETKGEGSRPVRKHRKRKRDDELLSTANADKTTVSEKAPTPSQRTPPHPPDPQQKPPKELLSAPSTPTPTTEATRQYAPSPPVSKRHRVVDPPSTPNLRSPLPCSHAPVDSDLEDLRVCMVEYITRHIDAMRQLVVVRAELQTMVLEIQGKIEKVAQKVNAQR